MSQDSQGSYFFSHLVLRPEALQQAELYRALRSEYQLHQRIWSLLSDGTPEPRAFVYRFDTEVRGPFREPTAEVYLVSQREPVDPLGLWDIRTQPLNPKLEAGMPLQFSLRANPVVSRREPSRTQEGKTRAVRHDLILDVLKKQKEQEGSSRQPRPVILQEAALDWLEQRAEAHGFVLNREQTLVGSHCQHWLSRPRDKQDITFSTVDFQGSLTVQDPERFYRTLTEGIGHQRAFGCGLLLVRRR